MGSIITFYSYKGGTGRSMALANISILLAQWGFKVLIIDWDLEAPGLEYFFADYYNFSVPEEQKGIVDILIHFTNYQNESAEEINWENITNNIFKNESDNGKLDILTAGKGKEDKEYFKKVRELDFGEFYSKFNGGEIIENLRNQWKENYDFVLIDSRTGVTDIGGICTIQLPDILVLLFTATKQAFEGILNIAKITDEGQKSLAIDRLRLLILPIPSKFDSRDEFKISQEWLNDFSKRLKPIYENLLPTSVKQKEILEVTKIPYISYFSFGEKLPVIEQGTTDSTGLGYAYENIAALIADNFQHVEMLVEDRDELVNIASNFKKRETITKPKIFISYSHKDSSYKDLILKHLSVLSAKNEVSLWSDRKIQPGHDWYEEITKAISDSNIALLLISADFLTSPFVSKEEIPRLLKRQKSSNLKIIPIIIRACAWQQIPFLSNLPVFPKDGIPFSSLFDSEREKSITDLVEMIANIVKFDTSEDLRDSSTFSRAGKLESHKKNLERITFIKELYEKLVDLNESLYSILRRLQAVGEASLEEKVNKLGKNFNELRKYYLYKRIFFKESECELIDIILESAKGIFYDITTFPVNTDDISYHYDKDLLKERHQFWDKARGIYENEVSELKNNLENEFRSTIGINS